MNTIHRIWTCDTYSYFLFPVKCWVFLWSIISFFLFISFFMGPSRIQLRNFPSCINFLLKCSNIFVFKKLSGLFLIWVVSIAAIREFILGAGCLCFSVAADLLFPGLQVFLSLGLNPWFGEHSSFVRVLIASSSVRKDA